MFSLFPDEYDDPASLHEPKPHCKECIIWQLLFALAAITVLVLLYEDGRWDTVEKARNRSASLQTYCRAVDPQPVFCQGVE